MIKYHDLIHDEFEETIKIMQFLMNKIECLEKIASSAKIIIDAFKEGGKVLTCGNGGSHCNAMHFAEELTGRYRDNRIGYAAIAISDPAYISCVGNDFGYKHIFSRFIESVGNSKDVLLAISVSGKSDNILYAIEVAHKKNMKVIFLTGNNRAINSHHNLSCYIDIEICVPYLNYCDYVQEVHLKIIHVLISIIEKEMLLH